MSFIPHGHVSPSDKTVHPTPDAHQDEAFALGRVARSSVSAFVGLGLALAGAAATYFDSPTLLIVGVFLAAAAIAGSVYAGAKRGG